MHYVASSDHVEDHFESTALVRDVVIGMSDGLTVPFALAAGLSGAVGSSHIVVLAGLAEIAAGSIAMGLGGYLAARSDAEHYASGVERTESDSVLLALKRNPKAWVDFMMRFELGLEKPASHRARQSAAVIAFSYIAGGFIPLLPYMVLLHASSALRSSVVITLIALFFFGAVKGRLTGGGAWKSALQTVFIGGLAAGAAYTLARLLSVHPSF